MNGKYLLDTNFIIYALNARAKLPLLAYFYSPITKIELLAYTKLTQHDYNAINTLLSRMTCIDCDAAVIDATIDIRRTSGLKLPDSLICATVITSGATLVTNDDRLHKVEGVKTIRYDDFMKFAKFTRL
jgi:predicted nucleic acid-binding protein